MTPVPLHLLRHGEPLVPHLLLGSTDAAPRPSGITACRRRTAHLAINAVVTSDLCRAAAAGEAIARGRSLSVRQDPRWRELDFGAWEGLAAANLDPQALDRFWRDPEAHPPPGGERWSSLVNRVSAAVAEVSRPTLVVTHGGAMRAALAALCGFSLEQIWAFDLPYAALLSLAVWPGGPARAQITGLRT